MTSPDMTPDPAAAGVPAGPAAAAGPARPAGPAGPAAVVARTALDEEREVTRQRIGALTAEFDEIVAGAADANGDDEHDPEGSTIAFERAKTTGLLLEARIYLDELNHAVERLDSGAYGRCEHCGGAIAPERLAARPATRTCISCAAAAQPPP
jgi:DnaK suppressor protein